MQVCSDPLLLNTGNGGGLHKKYSICYLVYNVYVCEFFFILIALVFIVTNTFTCRLITLTSIAKILLWRQYNVSSRSWYEFIPLLGKYLLSLSNETIFVCIFISLSNITLTQHSVFWQFVGGLEMFSMYIFHTKTCDDTI